MECRCVRSVHADAARTACAVAPPLNDQQQRSECDVKPLLTDREAEARYRQPYVDGGSLLAVSRSEHDQRGVEHQSGLGVGRDGVGDV